MFLMKCFNWVDFLIYPAVHTSLLKPYRLIILGTSLIFCVHHMCSTLKIFNSHNHRDWEPHQTTFSQYNLHIFFIWKFFRNLSTCFYFNCMNILSTCMCVFGNHGDQKRVLDPLELELPCGTQTQVVRKSNMCPEALSPLASLWLCKLFDFSGPQSAFPCNATWSAEGGVRTHRALMTSCLAISVC